MSRIGKKIIQIPQGVQIQVSDKNLVTVKGPKGELKQQVDSRIDVNTESNIINVTRKSDDKISRSMHGLYRTLINNMVVGVSEGYKTVQELVGVGYKANANGQILELTLGYSHAIYLEIPNEVKVSTTAERGQNPTIILESIDKQLIGQVAAKIRSFRAPEPYKGKGIKFAGEVLRRKAGKSASAK